jgi:hypothetical protein
VALGLLIAGTILAFHQVSGSSSATPALLALAPFADPPGGTLSSGQQVSLHWKTIPGARYRVQIVAFPVAPLGGSPSFENARAVTTTRASYALSVHGAQVYFWRVQVFLHGGWQSYSQVQHFFVAPPEVGVATLLTPRNGSVLLRGTHRFCWTKVPRASDYLLLVDGHRRAITRATCTTLRLAPGAHHWSVRVRVDGAHLYKGKRSAITYFSVLPGAGVPQHHASTHLYVHQ